MGIIKNLLNENKLTKTQKMIMDTIERDGKFHADVGSSQRTRGTKMYSYGARLLKAINDLEAKGLVKTDRETIKTQGYQGKVNRTTSIIVTKK